MKRQRVVAIYRQYKKPFDAYFLRAPIVPLGTHERLSGKLSLLSARANNHPKAYTAFMPVSGVQTEKPQIYSGLNLNQDKATKPQTV